MRKSTLFLLLLTPLLCCAKPPVAPRIINRCAVPAAIAPPTLHPVACAGDPTEVCLPVADTVALARWIFHVKQIEGALAGCNLVTRVPQ
jgi:hypothetical protein